MQQFFTFPRTALLALLLLSLPLATRAQQGVGIGTTTPDAAAALDVVSTTKGLLPPRLTTAQRDAMTTAQNLGAAQAGLLIFNTTTGIMNQWNGSAWTVPLVQPASSPTTFAYTGGPQSYTVPAGVTRLTVTATGAAGGNYAGQTTYAPGARVTATIAVTPGEVLTIVVGGQGGRNATVNPGGYNGGGGGGGNAGGGGGATDLRRSPTAGTTADYLSSRNALLVAGGGGGSDGGSSLGGAGGTPTGADGIPNGPGASQTAPGGGGFPGTDNQGGTSTGRGGGGGGYYGGGGGQISSASGGGGGSSWVVPAATGVTYSVASSAADGSLTLGPALAEQPLLPAAQVADLPWTQNGTSLYPSALTSNVGVGTSTPTQRLDVDGGLLVRANGLIRNQGAHLQWNRSGFQGETLLLNQKGLGQGAIVFGASDAVTTGSNTVTEWARFDNNGHFRLGVSGTFAANTAGPALEWAGPNYNTDPIGLYRYNAATNSSELRLVVGDDPGTDGTTADRFVVGTAAASAVGQVASATFTPQFTVQGNGRVGIGVTSPVSMLHVFGTASTSFNPGAGSTEVLLGGGGLTKGAAIQLLDDGVYGGGLYFNLHQGADQGKPAADTWPNNVITPLTLLPSGLVGIGTTTPAGRLHLLNDGGGGGQNDDYLIDEYGSGDQAIYMRHANGTAAAPTDLANGDHIGHISFVPHYNGGMGYTGSVIQSHYRGNGTNNVTDLQFFTSTLERLRISETGRVGVGTTAPASQLANTSTNIIGSDGIGISSGSLTWANAAQGYAGAFYNGYATDAHGLAVKVASTSSSSVALEVSGGAAVGTAGNSLFRVRADGNVGIGTGAPSQKLDVNGNVQVGSANAVGKVLTPATANRNMLAVAYGQLGSDSSNPFTIYSSSANYTASRTGTGVYRITFTANSGLTSVNFDNMPITATLYGAPGFVNMSGGVGYIEIRTYNVAGNLFDRIFCFTAFAQ